MPQEKASTANKAGASNPEADWLRGHSNVVALAIMLAGFLARLWTASGTFLNADEAVHFRIANQTSLALVYRASLTESHPPLLYFVLHVVRVVGTSELWLRLPSVIAGTIFCWILFRWLSRVAGELTGFAGLVLASLLPPSIRLSAEIRQYALMLVLLMAALYFLERALDENSFGRMLASAICLDLGLLSHYSAFFFTAGLGVYGLMKVVSRPRPTARIVALWGIVQAGAVALILFLYETHLSRLGRGESRTVLQGWMSEFYLRHSYFQAGHDNPILFILGHSFGVFQFVFGQLAVGDVAGVMFVIAMILLWRRSENDPKSATHRQLAIFCVLLFALACGASLAHVYPYGGTRHGSFLMIPALTGVAFSIARLARERWMRGVTLALGMAAVCIAFGKEHQPYMTREDQSLRQMQNAMAFLRQNAKPQTLIFTDYESNMILGYYLCAHEPFAVRVSSAQFETFSCGGYQVAAANRTTATNFTPDVFLRLWPNFSAAYNVKPNEPVWIVQAGWNAQLPVELRRLPSLHNLQFQRFGDNLKIFELTAADVQRAISSSGPMTGANESP
ncbi:MAG TPA: glycosyltransferase family 39 protein [Verrucomicrobiae bacterium]|nr:glycosyltransferase family 39 protein [Verrucomicrobiae bacterium]